MISFHPLSISSVNAHHRLYESLGERGTGKCTIILRFISHTRWRRANQNSSSKSTLKQLRIGNSKQLRNRPAVVRLKEFIHHCSRPSALAWPCRVILQTNIYLQTSVSRNFYVFHNTPKINSTNTNVRIVSAHTLAPVRLNETECRTSYIRVQCQNNNNNIISYRYVCNLKISNAPRIILKTFPGSLGVERQPGDCYSR